MCNWFGNKKKKDYFIFNFFRKIIVEIWIRNFGFGVI